MEIVALSNRTLPQYILSSLSSPPPLSSLLVGVLAQLVGGKAHYLTVADND